MDGDRFDRVVRALASGAGTRRTLIQAGGASLLTAALAQLGIEDAAARCVGLLKRCGGRKGGKCCGDGRCRGRRCRCPGGREILAGGCTSCCPDNRLWKPDCGCCLMTDAFCTFAEQSACCSATCESGKCKGRGDGFGCTFGAQCKSGFCNTAGVCATPGVIS